LNIAVDVRRAGEGQLEIMVNSGNLPNTVESDTTGVYRMSFVPEEPGIQKVEIIFNKESHPGKLVLYPFQHIYAFYGMCEQCRSRSTGTLVPFDQYLHCLLLGQK
jgi:hypothetical protein